MTPAKGSPMPKMPKADEETKEYFRSVVPDHPAVTVRPMFGNLSAFVNGNMFMGVFGTSLFVRLPEVDHEAILEAGGAPFEPMPGRPMRGYMLLPSVWRDEPERIHEWVTRSLDWAEELPPKEPKKKQTKKRAP
jgi:TfoX/Sxy family transcriptional regulator of competence genes